MLIDYGCQNSTEAVRKHLNLDRTDLDAVWWKEFATAGLTPVGGSDPRIGTGWVERVAQRVELAEAGEEERAEEARLRDLARVREVEQMADAERLSAWARNMVEEEEAEEARLRARQREFEDEEERMRAAALMAEMDKAAQGDQAEEGETPGQRHQNADKEAGEAGQRPETPALASPLPLHRPIEKGKARAIVPQYSSPHVSNDSNDEAEEDDEDDEDDQPAFSQNNCEPYNINAPTHIRSAGTFNYRPFNRCGGSFNTSGGVSANVSPRCLSLSPVTNSFYQTITNTPRRSRRLAGPAPGTPEVIGDQVADFFLHLLDTGITLPVGAPDTLQIIMARFRADTELNMRPCFRGIMGSGKPPRWIKVTAAVWNDVWDDLMWATLRRQCARLFPVPTVQVEVCWEFPLA